jgi:hypothetical protein
LGYFILQSSQVIGLKPNHITGAQENWRLSKNADAGRRTRANNITGF